MSNRLVVSLIVVLVFFQQPIFLSFEAIGHVNWNNDELRIALKEFAHLYSTRPIKDNDGGMNSAHMFYVWFITRKLNPKFIIESGVFKGQSSWLFEVAAPNAKIISIDPNLQQRVYISKKIRYETTDFSNINWDFIDKEHALCFFDDHQGIHRIKQCYKLGFKHILYEDNYPGPGGNLTHDLAVKATFSANTDDARFLRSVLKIYYECPPIYPNFTGKRFSWEKIRNITPEPLLVNIKDPLFEVYQHEAFGYTWLAYISL